MLDQNTLVLSAQIVKSAAARALQGAIDPDLKAKARACFTATHDPSAGWMLATPDDRFRVGAAALLLMYDEGSEERERISHEMRVLNSLGAAMSGIPVDFESALDGFTEEQAIGLMGIFREVAEKLGQPIGG